MQFFISHLPAALASLLFDLPEPQNSEKNAVFCDFLTFSRTCIFSRLTFSMSELLPRWPAFSSLHIVGSLASKLPSNRSGTPDFRLEDTLGGKVAFRGRQSKVSVSAVAGLDLQKWSTKSAQDCSDSSVSHKINKRKKHKRVRRYSESNLDLWGSQSKTQRR